MSDATVARSAIRKALRLLDAQYHPDIDVVFGDVIATLYGALRPDQSTPAQRLGGENTEDLLAELKRRGWTLVTMSDGLTRVVEMPEGSDGEICSVVIEREHDDAPAYFLYRLGALT
jgi:hypothetical protein